MNKNEFVAAIAEKSGLTKKDAEAALNMLDDEQQAQAAQAAAQDFAQRCFEKYPY